MALSILLLVRVLWLYMVACIRYTPIDCTRLSTVAPTTSMFRSRNQPQWDGSNIPCTTLEAVYSEVVRRNNCKNSQTFCVPNCSTTVHQSVPCVHTCPLPWWKTPKTGAGNNSAIEFEPVNRVPYDMYIYIYVNLRTANKVDCKAAELKIHSPEIHLFDGPTNVDDMMAPKRWPQNPKTKEVVPSTAMILGTVHHLNSSVMWIHWLVRFIMNFRNPERYRGGEFPHSLQRQSYTNRGFSTLVFCRPSPRSSRHRSFHDWHRSPVVVVQMQPHWTGTAK